MDEFRTIVRLGPGPNLLNFKDHILTLGSCFSDVIGGKLQDHKISALCNPFGVIYNPLSLHKALLHSASNQTVSKESFLQNRDVYLNYDFHSVFSALDLVSLEKKVNEAIEGAHHFLRQTDYVMLTYGTAWVYERMDTGEVVANCHKMPTALFTKKLLTQKRIIESFQTLYTQLRTFNRNIKIILTVSPVRHVKDTLQLNSVSKAVLRLTCHTLTETFADVEYFPSYEMMMDDLRDYRFYKADMLHPSAVAEDYIWEKFAEHYFDVETKKFVKEWSAIRTALDHKPFHRTSEGHQNFLKQILRKLDELKPVINVDSEINSVKSQLT